MQPHRLLRTAFRALVRAVPRRLHTRRLAAGARVLDLTPSQREELARNLSRMLRPEIAEPGRTSPG